MSQKPQYVRVTIVGGQQVVPCWDGHWKVGEKVTGRVSLSGKESPIRAATVHGTVIKRTAVPGLNQDRFAVEEAVVRIDATTIEPHYI